MSTKQTHISKLPLVLSVALLLVAVAVCVHTVFIAFLWQRSNTQNDLRLAHLIIDSVDKLNKPMPKDTSGHYYVPEAQLRLPAPISSLGDIVYNYTAQSPITAERLHIASAKSIRGAQSAILQTVGDTSATFDAVPKLQTCARGVLVTFSPQQDQTAEATKPLSNGRTAYFYNEAACKNPDLVTFVQQLDAY